MGPTGPPGELGPTGPTNVSDILVSLNLLDNKIIIPEQIHPITYYSVNLKNGNELRNIQSNLKNNQIAYILIELCDIYTCENSCASILTMFDEKIIINYKKNILLTLDEPLAMLKIYNINTLNLIECVTFYKNNFVTI